MTFESDGFLNSQDAYWRSQIIEGNHFGEEKLFHFLRFLVSLHPDEGIAGYAVYFNTVLPYIDLFHTPLSVDEWETIRVRVSAKKGPKLILPNSYPQQESELVEDFELRHESTSDYGYNIYWTPTEEPELRSHLGEKNVRLQPGPMLGSLESYRDPTTGLMIAKKVLYASDAKRGLISEQ